MQLPRPKGKSRTVCCCPSVPHGALMKTCPYFVIGSANPVLNLGPASATLLGSAKTSHLYSQGKALGIVFFPDAKVPGKLLRPRTSSSLPESTCRIDHGQVAAFRT